LAAPLDCSLTTRVATRDFLAGFFTIRKYPFQQPERDAFGFLLTSHNTDCEAHNRYLLISPVQNARMTNGAKLLWILIPSALLVARSYNICGGVDCIPGQFVNEVFEFGSGLFTIAFVICAMFGACFLYDQIKS
jgi:hypothetical protein